MPVALSLTILTETLIRRSYKQKTRKYQNKGSLRVLGLFELVLGSLCICVHAFMLSQYHNLSIDIDLNKTLEVNIQPKMVFQIGASSIAPISNQSV